ncbi:MAG: ABC transporter ATP-binding protein [Myxococcota bacterium]
MIHLENLHKHYREDGHDNHVLRGVSLHVRQGEFVALMGASGSGKSTMLNIIGGLDRDYDGVVEVAGRSLAEMDDKAQSRYRNRVVSFVFQQFHLLSHLQVVDNVAMPSWFDPERGSRDDLRGKAAEILQRVGLGDKVSSSPKRLSGGEKQRVAIARALFNNPKVLLADEPTGALDTDSGGRVMDIFGRLNEAEGLTVVVVTHDAEVARRCERIVRIRDGRIVDDGEHATRGEG